MKNRPLCAVCIGLMIAIWVCRTAGIPVFGEPVLTAEEKNCLDAERQVTVTGLVTDRSISSETIRYTLRHVYVTICDRQIPFSGVFVSTEYSSENAGAEPGDLLRTRGELHALEPAGNPGQFDAAAYYACQKIWYRLWSDRKPEVQHRQSIRKVLFRFREILTGAYTASMREAPAGILAAMLMGDKALLTEESRRNFQAGGCLHLLVISGLHVTLLGMGLLQILLRLHMPQTPACIAASAGMILYTALAGSPVAAVRACIMFLVLMLARVMRWSYDSASSLAFAAILMLLANPGYLFHAGFQLSFAAAGAASLVSPLLGRCITSYFHSEQSAAGREALLRMIGENTILWGAVQLCTLPLTAYYFYEIPVWSLPLNLLLVPCVHYVLGAGAAGSLAVLALPRGAKWFLLPADLGLDLYNKILGLARILPGSSVVCGKPALWQIAAYYGILLFVLWMLRRKCGRKKSGGPGGEKRRRQDKKTIVRCGLSMAAACFVLFYRHSPAFSLTMLDVGQGDCVAVQRGKMVLLSDGGSTNVQNVGKYRILPYLESEGISCVDIACISHNDADHMNGIEEILCMIVEKKTAVRIGCVCMPAWMAETEDGSRIAEESRAAGAAVGWLERGDGFSAGDLHIEVLHPFRQNDSHSPANGTKKEHPADRTEEKRPAEQTAVEVIEGVPTGGAQSGNAGSVVLQVYYRGFTALLTGDLEKEGEQELLPYLSDIACLKVGHHGSRWSSSKEFLEITKPEIALVSAPKKSMYGHPHQEALDRLESAGARVFATKDCGAVSILAGKDGMEVRTYLPGSQ